jgi:ketosteroid isomerase-like protein
VTAAACDALAAASLRTDGVHDGLMHAVGFSALCSRLSLGLAAAAAFVAASGCGSSPPPAEAPAASAGAAVAGASSPLSSSSPPSSAARELTPALQPLAWWLGTWDAEDGSSREHWVANGGALYGVALDARGGFEVLIVDDGEDGKPADGKLRLFAMPGGSPAVEFAHVADEGGQGGQGGSGVLGASARFANPAHDFPKQVSYRRDGDALAAEISGDGKAIPFRFRRAVDPPREPALEQADLAFAADTARRGVDGWVAAFEPTGWMLEGSAKRVGAEQLRALMKDFLAAVRIEWAPVASARRGDLGFTLGKATFTNGTKGTSWRGTYVTLWHRQPDGSWKVRFDTGRVVNEP